MTVLIALSEMELSILPQGFLYPSSYQSQTDVTRESPTPTGLQEGDLECQARRAFQLSNSQLACCPLARPMS